MRIKIVPEGQGGTITFKEFEEVYELDALGAYELMIACRDALGVGGGDPVSIADEARAELVAAAKRLKKYHDDGFIRSEFRGDMNTVLDSILSRKPEAAPSDTDREALARVIGLVLHGPGGYVGLAPEVADAIIAAGFSRSSQPVQVEVTDDMVKRGQEAWTLSMSKAEGYRKAMHAALSAALGGGE